MRHRLPAWSARWPQQLAGKLGHALLPASCALCGARCAAAVCGPCRHDFLEAGTARCPVCANPVGARDAGLACGACQAHAPAYDSTTVAADYGTPLAELVMRLKFGGQLALAPWFGQMLAEAVKAHGARELPALLCPVPLGPQRLVERGFNQALEIARPLARALGIALHPALALRVRDTAAQSGVQAAERKRNIRHAFTVAPQSVALLRGQHIGVVDDVMTSGATLHEMAAMFKRFGVARVSNYVFARTPPH